MTVINSSSVGKTQSDKAALFGSMETASTAAIVAQIAEAKEEWQGGPFVVMQAMIANYGDKLNEFPEPGSETGNNPDKYKVSKPGKDGVAVMRQSSFYTEFTKATPAGKAIVLELEHIKRAQDINDNKAGIPADIIAFADDVKVAGDRVTYLKGRLAVMQQCYIKAVKLGIQMGRVEDIPNVGFQFRYTDDTETALVNTPMPVWVYQPNGTKPIEKQKAISLQSFMKINVAKAIENGGGYDETLKTLARDTDGPAIKLPKIETVDLFKSYATTMHVFTDKVHSESKQQAMGEMVKALVGAGSDDFLVSVTDIRNFFNDLLNKVPKAGERYQDAISKETDRAAA